VTGRATDAQLDALHGLLSEAMQEELERYRAKGEGIPPAFLGQCIKFLKDNSIDAPARAQKLHDRLAASMPDFDEVDANPAGAPH
jgi:hypothetical protein